MPTPDWKWPKLMEGGSEINIFLKLLVNFGDTSVRDTAAAESIRCYTGPWSYFKPPEKIAQSAGRMQLAIWDLKYRLTKHIRVGKYKNESLELSKENLQSSFNLNNCCGLSYYFCKPQCLWIKRFMLRILEWKQLFIQPENQGLADYLNLFSVEQSNSYIV